MPVSTHDSSFAKLTKRHIEVLGALERASTQADMARDLSISVPTLKSHLRTLYGLTDTASMLELHKWWTVNGRLYVEYVASLGGISLEG